MPGGSIHKPCHLIVYQPLMPTIYCWAPVPSTAICPLVAPLWTILCGYFWILRWASIFCTDILLSATPCGFITGRPLAGDLRLLLVILLEFTTPEHNVLNCIRSCNNKRNREQESRQKKQQQGEIFQTSNKKNGKRMDQNISKCVESGLACRTDNGPEPAINNKKCMEKSVDHFGP